MPWLRSFWAVCFPKSQLSVDIGIVHVRKLMKEERDMLLSIGL